MNKITKLYRDLLEGAFNGDYEVDLLASEPKEGELSHAGIRVLYRDNHCAHCSIPSTKEFEEVHYFQPGVFFVVEYFMCTHCEQMYAHEVCEHPALTTAEQEVVDYLFMSVNCDDTER